MEKIKYQEMEELEKFHWWFVYRQQLLKFIQKKYLSSLDRTAKILDIGCGTGGNLKLLSEHYENISGVDNSEEAIKYCKEKGLNNVFSDKLPELTQIEDDSIDLIILFDVLEHVEDDEKALFELKDKLKKEGYVFLTVPAYNFLWSNHDEEFHHKRRYTKKQLEKMLESAGFKTIKTTYIYFLLFPLVLFFRIIKQFSKSYAKVDDFKINNQIINFVFLKLLSIEKFFLKFIDYPFGSSVLILAQNK